MNQRTQREKILITTAAVVFLVVASWFVWKPLIATWQVTSTRAAAKRVELGRVHAMLDRQPQLEKDYQGLIENWKNPEGTGQVPDVLQKFEQLAHDAGVTVRDRRPQTPVDQGGFTKVALDCSVEASTEALVKLLYAIQTAQALLDVTELKITPTPANPATLRADLRVVSLRSSGK